MPGARVGAVVSRGGRPDLAGDALYSVRAPTLLIVGRHDEEVLELNRRAYRRLTCPKRLLVIPARPTCSRSPGPSRPPAGRRRAGWSSTWSWCPAGGRHGVRPLPVSRRLSLRTVRRRKAPTRWHSPRRIGPILLRLWPLDADCIRCLRGSSMRMRSPCGLRRSAVIRPPCRYTMAAASVSPRPRPACRPRAGSPR